MSDVTAVPLPPTPRRMLAVLWVGIAALILFAGWAAWAGTTGGEMARKGDPATYLAWNGKQPGVVTTASGLEYKILTPGDGKAHPTVDDVALVGYEGRLRDGKVFDKNERAPFPVTGVIPGWTEGLQLMSKGAKYRFWIPPALAYGERGAGDGVIPPNADLEFDVTLIDFIPAAVLRQLQMQQQGGAGAPPPGGTPPWM